MIPAVLTAALAFLIAAAPASNEPYADISLNERVPFGLIFSVPTGRLATITRSELIRIVSDILRRDTSFNLVSFDPNAMSACRGRLGCMSLRVRGEFEGERRQRDEASHLRYLLVLSGAELDDGTDRLSAVLVDTDRALEVLDRTDRSQPDAEARAEAQINRGSVVAAPARRRITSASDARAFLADLFTEGFRPAFEKSGTWRPYGALHVQTDISGIAIKMDGRPIGTTQAGGVTRIQRVRAGRRTLALTHPEYLPFETTIVVVARQTAEIAASLVRRDDSGNDVPRTATLWAGVAGAAAGIGLLAYALATPNGSSSLLCLENDPSCEGGREFISFGYDASKADTDPNAVNPSGLLVAPLGYSLAGAGLTWSLGALLSSRDRTPWIAILAGLGVGLLSYGLSAAISP